MNTDSLLSCHLPSGITVLFVGNNFSSYTHGAIITIFLSICHCSFCCKSVCEGSIGSWSGVYVCSEWRLQTSGPHHIFVMLLPHGVDKMFVFHWSSCTLLFRFSGYVLVCDVDCAVCRRALGLHIRSVEQNSRSKREGIFQDDDCIVKINDTELMDKSFSQSVNDFTARKLSTFSRLYLSLCRSFHRFLHISPSSFFFLTVVLSWT